MKESKKRSSHEKALRKVTLIGSGKAKDIARSLKRLTIEKETGKTTSEYGRAGGIERTTVARLPGKNR